MMLKVLIFLFIIISFIYVFYFIYLKLINFIINKPLFCNASINFNPDINSIKHLTLKNTKDTELTKNHKENAKICLFYTRIIIKIFCDTKFNYKNYNIKKIIYNDNEAVALIKVIDDNILICWKGTNTIRDSIYDVQKFFYTIKDNIKIHSGFYKYFNDVKDNIFTTINDILSTNKNIKNIFSSGHSLGAAVSTLSCYYFSEKYKDKLNILNYVTASPRVGNIDFVNDYSSKNITNILIVNLFDKITDLPSLNEGYHHVKTLNKKGFIIFYGDNGTYQDNHDPGLYFKYIDKSIFLTK